MFDNGALISDHKIVYFSMWLNGSHWTESHKSEAYSVHSSQNYAKLKHHSWNLHIANNSNWLSFHFLFVCSKLIHWNGNCHLISKWHNIAGINDSIHTSKQQMTKVSIAYIAYVSNSYSLAHNSWNSICLYVDFINSLLFFYLQFVRSNFSFLCVFNTRHWNALQFICPGFQ